MATLANPYGNLPLRIPMNEWNIVRKLTTTFRPDDGSPTDIDRSPFDRYVDLWWAALCVGVREGRTSVPSEWHEFVTGVVLNQDPWRIRQIELIALAKTQTPSVLEEPGRVIAIANEYSAAGMPLLLDAVAGHTEAIWAVTAFLRSLAEPSAAGTAESGGR